MIGCAAEHNMAWDDSDAEEDDWGECRVAAPACRTARVLAHGSRACLGIVRRASTYVCPSVPRVFVLGADAGGRPSRNSGHCARRAVSTALKQIVPPLFRV